MPLDVAQVPKINPVYGFIIGKVMDNQQKADVGQLPTESTDTEISHV
jgi:hypothetical protein